MKWDEVGQLLQTALDRQDTHRLVDVLDALEQGQAQLWTTENSCAVTEIIEYPSGARKARIWLAAGKRAELLSMLRDIEIWAKDERCTSVYIVGRRGWKRILKDYKEPHTMLEKFL